MSHKLILRYLILILGLFFMGQGIALITKSNLGTSPISSLPLVFSYIFPLTFGQFTFLLSLVFLCTEILVLRREFPKGQLLQLLIGPFFGYFTDLGMDIFSFLNPVLYPARLSILLIGCLVMAMGIYLQVAPNVLINPGEGVVKAIAYKSHCRFGNVKIGFDTTLALLSVLLSWTVFGSICGIREGTIISAFLVGYLVKICSNIANRFQFESRLCPQVHHK